MRSQLDSLLYSLILALTSLRSPESDSSSVIWSIHGRARGFIDLAASFDLITHEQWLLLGELISNAHLHSGKPFPDKRNLGPAMPYVVQATRARLAAEKPQAQVPAHDEQVSAPAPRRELRLLCLLVPSRSNGIRSLPVGGMHAVPPRVRLQGRWPMVSDAGLYLRKAHAVQPSPEVLERVLQLRQTHAIRTTTRTLRTGVTA